MSEKHGHSGNIASLKANVGDDAALMEPIISYRSILDGENLIVNYNEILLGALERMKAKYHDSARSMLQLQRWETRAKTQTRHGTIMPDEVFTGDKAVKPEMLTFRRIIGIITHPKDLSDDERVKDALLIAESKESDYISDDIVGLVSDLNRGGVTGDTKAKVMLNKICGTAGRDIMGMKGIELPEGFEKSYASAISLPMPAGTEPAKEAARGFVQRVFHPVSMESSIFQEVTTGEGLWDRLPSLKSMNDGPESNRSGAEIEDMDAIGYAHLLTMFICVHDMIEVIAGCGRKQGFLPSGWQGGMIFTGTAEDLIRWMGMHCGFTTEKGTHLLYVPDGGIGAVLEDSRQEHNDDGTVDVSLSGAVLRMPDGRPNFGSAYKPMLLVGSQEDDESCD